ncbi:hypothetical protein FKB34_01935 [Glycocaulis profundi]|nr:hypothetical protein FKB34_01935 [Glycocaulis profundi]
MSDTDSMTLRPCGGGWVRYPRNVEEIRVEVESPGFNVRLTVRRNEDRRILHLTPADARLIARELVAAADRCVTEIAGAPMEGARSAEPDEGASG